MVTMDRPESPSSRICAVCRSKATQICGGCGEVSYCAKEHQKQHWPTHKSQCKPYKIVVHEKYGRYIQFCSYIIQLILICYIIRCMVATKNLKAGEIIFREKAAITGPKQGCKPVCLTCYAQLENMESIFRCSGCNFPFCREKCAKVIILRSHLSKTNLSKYNKITGLRPRSGVRRFEPGKVAHHHRRHVQISSGLPVHFSFEGPPPQKDSTQTV